MADMSELQLLVDSMVGLDEDSLVTVMTSVLQARPESAPAVVAFAVPDLTYPPHRALHDRRCTGTIKSFNDTKGFGFIECEEVSNAFGSDVFLHSAQAPTWARSGVSVNFALMLSADGKPQAYDLQAGAGKGAAKGGKGWPSLKGLAADDGGMGGCMGAMSAMAAMGAFGGPSAWEEMWSQTWNAGGEKGSGKDKRGAQGQKRPGKSVASMEVVGNHSGTIKSFNDKNGYGFIECVETKMLYGSDVFLHHAQIGEFKVGDPVNFNVYLNQSGKPQAKDLQDVAFAEPTAKRGKFDELSGWAGQTSIF